MPQWFAQTQVARAAYYDRNPTQKSLTATIAGAAFGATLILSYTVPARRGAFLEVLYAQLIRVVVTAVLGTSSVIFAYTTALGASSTAFGVYFQNNLAGSYSVDAFTNFGYLGAGDNISLYAACGDSTGQVQITGSMKGTQFEY